ncbi:FtsH protease activity modulator HflK, partial [Candidatus Woesearchaeota archaeon]|nr:FtsH protease activity modulator HflK [Candidatus Woesearchaeota archaeon]
MSKTYNRFGNESHQGEKPKSMLDQLDEGFEGWKSGGGKTAWKWCKRVVYGLAGIVLLTSSVYIVGPDEEGVIRRFGKYDRTTKSGLQFKLPFVEKLDKPKVTEVKKEEFGFRTLKPGKVSKYDERGDYTKESLMLTGDKAMVDLEFIVQYKIKDAKDCLFNVRDVRGTLRDVSEAAMRQVVGDKGIDDALTTGKIEVQEEVQKHLQEILDYYKTGLHVVTVRLQDVDPPQEVKDAFIDV